MESDEELDPCVPFPHGDDYTQDELDTWPDFEPWHVSWVGMSQGAIAYQTEQQILKNMDQKVLHRLRHNKALKVRCANQFHLDTVLEQLRITGGDTAMQPTYDSESSDDDFW